MTAGVSVRSVSLVSFAFSLVKLSLSVYYPLLVVVVVYIHISALLFIMRLDQFHQ